MVIPPIEPRAKEADDFAGDVIWTSEQVRFEKVACATGQSAVRFVVRTMRRGWYDVLDLEGQVEDRLGGLAILTSMTGTSGDQGVDWAHATDSR
jgi:hypothetical protein